MKLKTFLEQLDAIVKENPAVLEMDAVTFLDHENNCSIPISCYPQIGHYSDSDSKFHNKKYYHEYPELYKGDNAICVN